ncbi:MAG: hypothetical protein MJE63_00090 [Proteobacteria bacterium]|nr:hypothetical protein [Pseudomonadota bacterium]
MRFFEIVNLQHALGSLLVPLIFMVLFGVGLSLMPLVNSKDKKPSKELHQFNDDISEGDNPFPMVMALIIIGTVVWALFYILYYGFSEVTI